MFNDANIFLVYINSLQNILNISEIVINIF